MQTSPELEAILAANPQDTSTWQVYADWLTEHGEPWGAVIASACVDRPDAEAMNRAQAGWVGALDGVTAQWRHGTLEALVLRPEKDPKEGIPLMADALARVLAHPAGRLVRSLVLGLPPRPEGDIDWHFDDILSVIASAGPLPLLRTIDMSKRAQHMDQDSWRRIGDMSGLWAAAPRLVSLRLLGASGSDGGVPLVLGTITAPHLESIEIRSGGLDKEAPLAIGRAVLPSLTHLELWFGRRDYGNTCNVADLAGILSGQGLPKLTTLGLKNSEWETELIDAIADSAILPRIRSLDLSMGTLFRDGPARLLALSSHFAHLQSLNVDDNYIPEELREPLKRALPMISFGSQRTVDDEDGDYRYSSVGE